LNNTSLGVDDPAGHQGSGGQVTMLPDKAGDIELGLREQGVHPDQVCHPSLPTFGDMVAFAVEGGLHDLRPAGETPSQLSRTSGKPTHTLSGAAAVRWSRC
jgi:hypothetical protein